MPKPGHLILPCALEGQVEVVLCRLWQTCRWVVKHQVLLLYSFVLGSALTVSLLTFSYLLKGLQFDRQSKSLFSLAGEIFACHLSTH